MDQLSTLDILFKIGNSRSYFIRDTIHDFQQLLKRKFPKIKLTVSKDIGNISLLSALAIYINK